MRISAAGKVTPSSSKSPSSTTSAAAHRDVRDDALADVGLPDAHHRDAVARRLDQALGHGERADGRGEVAAVARPVDERLVDRDLAEEVVDVAVVALDLEISTTLLVLEVAAPMPSICLP